MGDCGSAAYVMIQSIAKRHGLQTVSPSHPKCPCLASRALNPFSWPSLIGSSTCTWPSSKNAKILEVCLQFSIAGSQNGFGLVFVSPPLRTTITWNYNFNRYSARKWRRYKAYLHIIRPYGIYNIRDNRIF